MKIKDILKNYKFYAELDRGLYAVYLNKGDNDVFGFLLRFKDLESVKKVIGETDIQGKAQYKAINLKFSYKDNEYNYSILKKEFFQVFNVDTIKQEEADIKKLAEKGKNYLETRKNINMKKVSIEETKLPKEIKKLKPLIEEKNIYMNITLSEREKYNLNLVYDKENLYFRVLPKNQENLKLNGKDFYKINDTIYFVFPVLKEDTIQKAEEKAQALVA